MADIGSGHNVVATVYLEWLSMYRADGPEEMRPVGETEFVAGVAAMSDSGQYGSTKVAAGIVGFADLTLGDRVEPVLQALVRQGVLKGIRGPRGGYQLAREARRITADEILRAISTAEEEEEGAGAKTGVLAQVVIPALAQAEVAFSGALSHINIEDLASAAQLLQKPA